MTRVPMLILGGWMAMVAIAGAEEATRVPLYWQDPAGRPFYSPGPKKSADGMYYKPVFDDGAPVPKPATAPKVGDGKILYYRNPMGLPDTSPRPKKDAMGMDYLPVYADEARQGDPPGTVRITPGRLQTLGVRIEAATMRASGGPSIHATGILQFDERRLATVTTKVSGWIESMEVAATGDSVRRGQVLAQIYSPDLVASEEEYLVAARLGGPVGAASIQRLRSLDVPETEIARLRKSGRSSKTVPVLAVTDGVVIEKPVEQGMRVDAGQALYRTADLSDLWLMAQVQERDLGSVVPGREARATFVAYPGRTFEGKVEFIYPSLSAGTRTARVRIALPNPDGLLRAGMFADVDLEALPGATPILSVPNSAVLDDGRQQLVLVARGEGRFEPRPVRLGTRGDEWIQVLEGLKPGDDVVVGANFLIDAESNLRAALQGFANGSTQPAAAGSAKP
jgi:Cu(I)/Ag(I) efflux system membrane fusion protein